MKNNVILSSIFIIALFVFGLFIYSAIEQRQNAYSNFYSDGYILSNLQSANNSVEKYFFTDDSQYKTSNEQIEFSDSDGNTAYVSTENFLHYSDGSISAFKNGVLVSLDQNSTETIIYYNIFANSILQSTTSGYQISNLESVLEFNSLIWKISSTKYLIVDDNISLGLTEGEITEVSNYIVVEFVDEGVIKLYNNTVTYQTINEDAKIYIGEDIELNLSNKYIYKDGEELLNLSQMVIDASDNVEILPVEEEKDEEDSSTSGGSIGGNYDSGYTGSTSSGTDSYDDYEEITLPSFSVVNLETSSIKLDATIYIEDELQMLVSNTTTKLINNQTGATVHSQTDSNGVYNISIYLENLIPNTEYTLISTASYEIEGITYTKDFLSKIIRTEEVGVTIEKNYLTNNEISVVIGFGDSTKVQSLDVLLYDKNSILLETKTIFNVSAEDIELTFSDLVADTNYTIQLGNFLYYGSVISNGFEISGSYTTLKEKPILGDTNYYINKTTSSFDLFLGTTTDTNNGVVNYRYEIYDNRLDLETTEPVLIINQSSLGSVSVSVDDVTLYRGVPYVYKVVAEFYDNEKTIEYDSNYSNVMTLDGVAFPTITFNESEVTFESISGILQIYDEFNTVQLSDENYITVVYTNSLGISESFTTSGSLTVPVDINNLRSNETYTISVFASVNLQDGNEIIDQAYLGKVIVNTKEPDAMVANLSQTTIDLQYSFVADFSLMEGEENTDLEASTLTGLTFTLYPGQTTTSTPVRTINVYDNNTSPYESDLADKYYYNVSSLTPEFFGLENADLTEAYYTITITAAYDYTDYKNELPIESNSIIVKTNAFIPPLPSDPDDAFDVEIIRNKDAGEYYDSTLASDTIVGYKIRPYYDNTDGITKEIRYYVHDAETGEILSKYTKVIVFEGTEPVESVYFWLDETQEYGSSEELNFSRGNEYYFTMEADLDLDFDGEVDSVYPYDTTELDIIFRSIDIDPVKQSPTISLYVADSNDNETAIFKYIYSDVDHSLYNSNVSFKINGTTKHNEILKTNSAYTEILVDNMYIDGTMTATGYYVLYNNVSPTAVTFQTLPWTTNQELEKITYSLEIKNNQVLVSIDDYFSDENALDNIVSFDISFTSNGKTLTKENMIHDEGVLAIDLFYIDEFIGEDIEVNVSANYVDGDIGFELDSTNVAIQTIETSGNYYVSSSDDDYGLIYKEDATSSLFDYNFSNTSKSLDLTSLINSKTMTWNLTMSSSGISYSYRNFVLKSVSQEALSTDGSGIINFDYIIPAINLISDNKLNIDVKLTSADVYPVIELNSNTTIVDDILYVELYETNILGTQATLFNVLEYDITEFENSSTNFTISGLSPQTYYYMKFYVIVDNDGTEVKEYLYDTYYGSVGNNYYFSTLSDVEISDLSVELFNPSHAYKYLSINYTLGQISGYDEINYYIYKLVDGEYVLLDIDIPADEYFMTNMSKIVPIELSSELTFSDSYLIKVVPTATVIEEESEVTYNLGEASTYYYLYEQNMPFIGISSQNTDIGLSFYVSIADSSAVIVDNTYTINIYDSNGNDVTPEEYRNNSYSVDELNKKFSLIGYETMSNYTINVNVVTNPNHVINSSEYVLYSKEYTAYATSEFDVDLGELGSSSNTIDRSRVDILFFNSYNLQNIDTIRYSIYSISGTSISGVAEFTPTLITNSESTYYYFTLPELFSSTGTYYIEVQFYIGNYLVTSGSQTYSYIGI
ncbi:MAG: hypothetical protein R3Y21_01600 [Mycoplasmatota bacterium]